MKIFIAVCAVLLAASPARAEGSETEAGLRTSANLLLSLSDQDYRDLASSPEVSGKPWTKKERPALLAATYRRMAALRFRLALSAGLSPELKAKAEASLAGSINVGRSVGDDANAAAPDSDLLQNTGWAESFNSWVNSNPPRVRSYAAVAAVRGGRKLSTADDKEISRLLASVDAGDKAAADASATPSLRGQTQYDAGRAYERIAAIVSKPSAASEAAPAVAAPAPAASKTLSAKEIYQKDSPSVVLILAGRPNGQGELGTGSVIDASGRVLTNAHVVIDDQTGRPYPSVRVYRKPARVTGDTKADLTNPINAKVARYDRALDLAVLELDSNPRVPALILGDDATVETGDPVVAIGHPEQGGLWTLTQGVVSTVIADLGGVPGKNAFQTDASINRGNSGGPLIDRSGAIIGVNTSMARKAADGLTITSVNFSVKASVARRWLGAEAPAAPAIASVEPEPDAAADAAAPEAPAPAAPIAAPVAPVAPAEIPAPPKTKPVMITPAKPYRIDDVLAQEIKEMEDFGEEMHQEILRRTAPKTP